MKKLIPLLLLGATLTSCKNTWTQDDKDALYKACIEDAARWAGSPEKAKTYCECVVLKVMDKYPHVGDALEHVDMLSIDPEIKVCKTPILK